MKEERGLRMTPRFLALGTEKTGAPILIGNE